MPATSGPNSLSTLFLLLICVSCPRAQHVGTCFLSPFQFPASSSSPEFRTPIHGSKSSFRSTSAHANAPQVSPNELVAGERKTGNSFSQEKETSGQVKETTDRHLDGFLFPGEKPDRPSTPAPAPKSRPPPGERKGTDSRFVRPIEIPKRPPAPTKGGTETRFVFPGEGASAVRSTTRPPLPPVVQQREKAIVRRPASRIFSEDLFFGPENQLVNWEELEAISQFESALEEAKREGLYGLRTRSRPRTTTRPSARTPVRSSAYSYSGYETPGRREQGRSEGLGFFELGVSDFKESFGFDPLAAGLITRPDGQKRQSKQLFGSSSDEDFGPSVPPPPPLAQVLRKRATEAPVTQSPGRFYQWLDRSSFLRNMRIAPGTNFTVLLPNDEAIADLPEDFVRDLESNGTKMREILFYHMIPESLGVEAIEGEDMIPTLLRKKDIRVTKESTSDWIMMSGAKVLGERTDLEVDGGKVRFIQIDRLLMPPRGTLYDLIAGAPGLSVFRTLIQRTGLQSELQRFANSATNGLTIFAPTDTAFSQVDDDSVSRLTRDLSATRSLLLNHMAKPVIFAAAIPAGTATVVKNLGSQDEVRIERTTEQLVSVNGVTVSFADVLATNGVLHVIERVLL